MSTAAARARRSPWVYVFFGGGGLLFVVLACIACGFGADQLLFHNTESEIVFDTRCEGAPLSITYEHDRNELMGVSTNERAFGTWHDRDHASSLS